jgi:hypothetical protein
MPSGSGVPKAKPGDSISVNVFWSSLQFGEYCQIMSGISGLRVVNFEQSSFIALNNQRP